MVAFSPSQNLKLPNLKRFVPTLPTGGGVGAGLAAAAVLAALPIDLLERLVWTSGVASLVPAAQPPLGMTARALLALGGAVVAGAVVWAALFLLWGHGGFMVRERMVRRPAVRRADAHPDAPPRRPMTAADLGTPFMDVAPRPPVEQPLPADLDQPLASFDPDAIPPTPREPLRALAPLAPGERLDTFALTPPPPSIAPTRRDPVGAPSIDALLRRLEEGAARRPRQATAA